MASPLELEFNDRMVDIYDRAKAEAGYTATRFIQMVGERVGLDTARALIDGDAVSSGFTALWEAGRQDLTVEALVLDDRFQELFTTRQRRTAERRLRGDG